MPYNLDLSFRSNDPRKGEIPFQAARVIVVRSTGGDDCGLGAISSDCVSVSELEAQVSRLKRELDQVLAKGRRKFANLDRKMAEARRSQ